MTLPEFIKRRCVRQSETVAAWSNTSVDDCVSNKELALLHQVRSKNVLLVFVSTVLSSVKKKNCVTIFSNAKNSVLKFGLKIHGLAASTLFDSMGFHLP